MSDNDSEVDQRQPKTRPSESSGEAAALVAILILIIFAAFLLGLWSIVDFIFEGVLRDAFIILVH